MAKIEIKDPNFENPISYYMDNRIKRNLDEEILPSLQKKDKDYFLAIDGREGSGKSTLALQIGKYVDPSLDLTRVVFNADDFRQAVFKAKKGECVIFDEAFVGLSSRSSLSTVNRVLISLIMQMRQKNLFIIIVLPTFFLLDRYVALNRAKALIHVYENKGIRGYFRAYNWKLKKQLYFAGKKEYSYKVRTRFKGRFYGVFALGDKKTEDSYRKKKSVALESTEKNPMNSQQVRFMEQRNILIHLLRKNYDLSYRQIEEMLKEYNIDISYVQIRNICAKFGDTSAIKEGEEEYDKENKTKEQENIGKAPEN